MKPNQFFPGGFIAAQTSGYEAMVLAQDTFYQIPASAKTRRLVRRLAAGDWNAPGLNALVLRAQMLPS
jgi:hypothetical protein